MKRRWKFLSGWQQMKLVCSECGSDKSVKYEHEGKHFCNLCILSNKPGGLYWSAIGVDIDYAAAGNSRQELISNFSRGLKKTIELHIAKFGNADRIMSPPPAEEIAAFGESPERYTEIISI